MVLFGNGNRGYDVTLLRTTSKDALKRSALFVCGGDIKSATEICEYFMKDMPNMPDFDPPSESVMEQAKNTISGLLGWVDSNQDKLVGYYNLFQAMRGKTGIDVPTPPAPADVPPIM